jgi:uncharacterized protein (TIGR03032 family)
MACCNAILQQAIHTIMSQLLAPFTCIYSPNVPELLSELNCTLAISTYQAGKLIFIGAKDKTSLVQLSKNVPTPMGIAFDGNRLAVAGKGSVLVYAAAPQLATDYPRQPNTYDNLFLPRVQYVTGIIDTHDVVWVKDKLLLVNTMFSCLAWLDSNFNFEPYWKPPFITGLHPEDRCHLNGLAVEEGKPKYASMFAPTDTPQGWRGTRRTTDGLIIDIESNETVATGLSMPHSPRIINGKLYVLQSASGDISEVDVHSGKCTTVKNLGCYVRGMAFYRGFLFVAFSKIREKSSAFADLSIASSSNEAGIAIIHFGSGSVVGTIKYKNSVEEVYDLQVLPFRRPGLVNFDQPEKDLAISLPGFGVWGSYEKEDKK